jgi:putative sigma-54 modulation protein
VTVNIRSNGIGITHKLRKHVQRTIAFSLDRFAHRFESISVFLADLNGPRGGVSNLCQRASETEAAIKRAADRLKSAVSRRFNRRKRPVRVLSRTPVRSNAGGSAV